MKAFYSIRFVLPLPPGHRFPMGKYARLRGRTSALVVNVAGERVGEFEVIGAKLAAALAAAPDAFHAVELNLSCPNVESGFPFAKSPELAEQCVRHHHHLLIVEGPVGDMT